MSQRHEFDVTAGSDLDVRVDAGRVFVATGRVDRIVVDIDGNADDWDVTQVGSAVSVRPARRWRPRSTRVNVEVPEGCRIVVSTGSADVRLTGHLGDSRLRTASGAVEIGRSSRLRVSTASGDVAAGDVDGDVDIATVSGDVRVGAVSGRVGITTTSGDIELRRVGGDLDVKAVSGDILVDRFDGDDLVVKSVSGDLEVGLPGAIRVKPEIATLSGTTRLPERRIEPDPAEPRQRRVRVAFRSVSGDITIRRIDG